MMMKWNRIVLTGVALTINLLGWAQAKEMKEAYQDFGDLQFSASASKYLDAIAKMTDEDIAQKNFATYMVGECYRMMNDIDRAEDYYKPLIESDFGNTNPVIYLRWAQILRAHGQVDGARSYYQKYLKEDPRNTAAKTGLKSCDWMDDNAGRRARVNVADVAALNSPADDFSPAFSSSGVEKLVFTSNRAAATGKKPDQWTGHPFSDLFTAQQTSGLWNTPQSFDLSGVINTDIHEGAATFNRDCSRIYFTRCIKWDEKKRYCEILVSDIYTDSIGPPRVLFSDTSANFGQPALSNDELTIIFSSSIKDGEGGKDLYTAKRTDIASPFGKPESTGSDINTFGNEMFPTLCNDTVLFFASDGHEGYGGLDIYRSVLSDGKWTKPENLLWPFNSGYDDFGLITRQPDEEGFFTSNRPGGSGGDDIYHYTRRILQFSLSGKVRDNMTLLPVVGAAVYLTDENNQTVQALTDAQGNYYFGPDLVREYNSYDLVFRKENYFSAKDSLTTRPLQDDHNFNLDALLEPIPEKPIVLPDILYPLDQWILLPQYQDSLRGLVVLLNENPSLVIELRSHTDSRASNEYNDVLSQKRAQSVVDFLISEGIDPGRLVAKGYGERVFRILDKDLSREGYLFKKGTELNDKFIYALPTKEIQEAAFQLNRRTEFAVIAKDYTPTGRNASESFLIEVVSDSTEKVVSYALSDQNEMRVTCYLNDYGIPAVIRADSSTSCIAESVVQDLLKKGAVNRNDFEGRFEEIMVDGRIRENSVVNIKKVRLGAMELQNVRLRVTSATDLMEIGKELLGRYGTWETDSEKRQLIFK